MTKIFRSVAFGWLLCSLVAISAAPVSAHGNYNLAPNESWTSEAYFGDKGTFFADVTGDGKADAIVGLIGVVDIDKEVTVAFAAIAWLCNRWA